MKKYAYAVIRFDPNGSSHDNIILSTHTKYRNALDASYYMGNVYNIYVAKRKPDGEYETRIEARDRVEFGRPDEEG